MRRPLSLIIAIGCLATLTCARDPLIHPPVMMRVLTKETPMSTTSREPPGGEAARLSNDASTVEPVVRVSSRLIAAAQRSEYGSQARALCWVIAVYDDTTPRLLIRPDGGIVVYSGLFRLAANEAGLAALISHELVHVLAHYPAAVSLPCVRSDEPQPRLFTYQEEMQADEMGLKLMAQAGYDPRELLRLWERIKREEVGARDEVLVHLTYDRRIEQISQWLPDALIQYERANRAPQKVLPLR